MGDEFVEELRRIIGQMMRRKLEQLSEDELRELAEELGLGPNASMEEIISAYEPYVASSMVHALSNYAGELALFVRAALDDDVEAFMKGVDAMGSLVDPETTAAVATSAAKLAASYGARNVVGAFKAAIADIMRRAAFWRIKRDAPRYIKEAAHAEIRREGNGASIVAENGARIGRIIEGVGKTRIELPGVSAELPTPRESTWRAGVELGRMLYDAAWAAGGSSESAKMRAFVLALVLEKYLPNELVGGMWYGLADEMYI